MDAPQPVAKIACSLNRFVCTNRTRVTGSVTVTVTVKVTMTVTVIEREWRFLN